MATATLLPPGKVTFFDENGDPLVGGFVYFYVPNTLTPKNTWQDPAENTLNTNPVELDSYGSAIIYGNGQYRQIVKDIDGNTIWDQLTEAPIGTNIGSAQGSIIYRGATEWTVLAPGDAGQILTTNGNNANPSWEDYTGSSYINVMDYGATGNGATDDTTAIQDAIDAAIDQNRDIYFPKGTYIVTSLTWNPPGYAKMPNWIGDGKTVSVIKRKAGSSGVMVTLGDSASTIFLNINITGIGFDGLNTSTTSKAIECFNVVRSVFTDCRFANAVDCFYSNGGIEVTLDNCIAEAGTRGIKFETFASMAGNSYPNFIKILDCGIYDNTTWGIWFDSGRFCTIADCDVEGNGTNGISTSGGIRIGALIGSEGSLPHSIGGVIERNWFEANEGAASVVCLSGRNSVYNNYFVANPSSTYDIYMGTGVTTECNYIVESNTFDNARTPPEYNLYEDTTIGFGNYVNNNSPQTFSSTVDPVKTRVNYSNRGALVRKNANQTIGASSATALTWQTVVFDDYDTGSGVGFYDAAAPTRLTVPPGVFRVRVSAGLRWDSVADGSYIQLNILKNGSNFYGMGNSAFCAGATHSFYMHNVHTAEVEVVPGDYFVANAYQETGGNLDALSHESTWFAIEAINASDKI